MAVLYRYFRAVFILSVSMMAFILWYSSHIKIPENRIIASHAMHPSRTDIANSSNKLEDELGHRNFQKTDMVNSSNKLGDELGYINSHRTVKRSAYVSVECHGRLGNQIGQYSALFCCTFKNDSWIPYLSSSVSHSRVRAMFQPLSIPVMNEEAIQYKTSNKKARDIEVRTQLGFNSTSVMEAFNNNPMISLVYKLKGYPGLTWKFCHGEAEVALRNELRFRPGIQNLIRDYFRNITPPAWQDEEFIRVAIHNRYREDFKLSIPQQYFQYAMEYFRKQYDKVQFIVLTDGPRTLKWSQQYMIDDHIVFSHFDWKVDFTMFSMVDHAIISFGSFSWWGGWFCKGTTVFYDYDFIGKPHHTRGWATRMRNGDLVPPRSPTQNWIGCTGEKQIT